MWARAICTNALLSFFRSQMNTIVRKTLSQTDKERWLLFQNFQKQLNSQLLQDTVGGGIFQALEGGGQLLIGRQNDIGKQIKI